MSYRRIDLDAPRVAGTALKLLVWLAESPFGGPVRRRLVKDGGAAILSECAFEDAPQPLPSLSPPRLASGAAKASGSHLGDAPSEPSGTASEGSGGRFEAGEHCDQAPSPQASRGESISDFARAYRDLVTTPLAVAERVLECTRHSEALPEPLRCFISQDADDVMRMARESHERLRAGRARSVLEGVPIAIKDELDQVPYATTVGTSFLRQPARTDSAVVERLRASGALLIGKTNMQEIGIGVTGVNVHHGAARNPYDPRRMTGGSSSGSAAAVAAGLCPAAVGADGGGSIRIPASFCGLVGLKPTFGRVSEFGAAPLCWSLAHVGPLARNALDAALLYQAIAGPDERDVHTLRQPTPELTPVREGDVRGISIGVVPGWFEHAEPEVVATCRAQLERLVEAGARVREVLVPDLEWVSAAHMVTIGSEMLAEHQRYLRSHRGAYSHEVRLLFALIRSLPAAYYVTAQRVRARISAALRRVLGEVDVVATPATGVVAPPIARDSLETGESNLVQLSAILRFMQVGNLTGLPAIAFPAGHSPAGLPVGLQLIGRPWEEHLLLGFARAAESCTQYAEPKIAYRLLQQ